MPPRGFFESLREYTSVYSLQSVKKVEVQEALPPAGVIGAEPLTLVPQHFPRKPAKRCLRATAANSGFFDSLEGVYKRILPEAFAQNIAEYVTPRLSATF